MQHLEQKLADGRLLAELSYRARLNWTDSLKVSSKAGKTSPILHRVP